MRARNKKAKLRLEKAGVHIL